MKDFVFVPISVVLSANRVLQVTVIVPFVTLGIFAARERGTVHIKSSLTPVAIVPEAATAVLPDALREYVRSWVYADASLGVAMVIVPPRAIVDADSVCTVASGTVNVNVTVAEPTGVEPV